MATDFFSKLKSINKKSHLIVYGYLREYEMDTFGDLCKSNPYYNFPEIMLKICLIYYHTMDKWDKRYIGPHHELTKDGLCIENTKEKTGTSYGEIIASSPGVYKWRFKLNHVPKLSYSYWGIILGVWKITAAQEPKTKKSFPSITNYQGSHKWGYAFDAMNGTLVNARGDNAKTGGEYGRRCVTGDVVEVVLDLDVFTIKFNINDKDYGFAHKDIEDTEYRIALTTVYKGPIVEMLN